MDASNNKNSMFIVFTGLIIAVGRFLLGGIDVIANDDQHILIVMALVNYIALGFVLLLLYNDFCKKCKEKINSFGIETSVKKKCNNVFFIFSAVLLSVYLIFGILYMVILKTADLNDAISILALALSIATNGLVNDYADNYYKWVLKIAKKKRYRNLNRRK